MSDPETVFAIFGEAQERAAPFSTLPFKSFTVVRRAVAEDTREPALPKLRYERPRSHGTKEQRTAYRRAHPRRWRSLEANRRRNLRRREARKWSRVRKVFVQYGFPAEAA